MFCKTCNQEIKHGQNFYKHPKGGVSHCIPCPPKAERSEALQGCPPSATGSADARAADEAGADSSGRSADKAVRRDQITPDAEIATHVNAMMDELKWFYEHEITLEISPTERGWSIKFKMADPSADAHSAT